MAIKATKSRDWNFEQPQAYKLIPLTQGKFAMVDNEDFDKLKGINWSYNHYNYASNSTTGIMHRIIMSVLNTSLDVDHISGDRLDNRKINLRVCTRKQNLQNSSKRKGSSIYKGVSWIDRLNKWRAYIVKDGVQLYLGLFSTEEEAGRAYDTKAKELFGEFAKLNFKDERP